MAKAKSKDGVITILNSGSIIIFSVCGGKRRKNMEKHLKYDFDQQTAWGTPVGWSKYTTNSLTSKLLATSLTSVKNIMAVCFSKHFD